jgi:hypothetical protein
VGTTAAALAVSVWVRTGTARVAPSSISGDGCGAGCDGVGPDGVEMLAVADAVAVRRLVGAAACARAAAGTAGGVLADPGAAGADLAAAGGAAETGADTLGAGRAGALGRAWGADPVPAWCTARYANPARNPATIADQNMRNPVG